MKTTVEDDLRRLIYERENYLCKVCHKKVKIKKGVIHHLHYPARSFNDFVIHHKSCHGTLRRKFEDKEFLRLYSLGLNDIEIARRLNVSVANVSKRRRKLIPQKKKKKNKVKNNNVKVTIVKLPQAKCEKCNHKWTPRKSDVRLCPKCKTAYWDVKM